VTQADRRCDRWQRDHRLVVGLQQVDRTALDRADRSRVRAQQPLVQLLVEVPWRGEQAARQERGLQVAVVPLDQTLELWVSGRREPDPGREGAGERSCWGGHFPRPTDRGFPVPDQRLRHSADAVDQGPHARQDVPGLPGRDHHGGQEPGEAAGHDQHWQAPLLAGPDRHLGLGEPQIALGNLAGLVGHPVDRVDPDVLGPDQREPFPQGRQRVRPADPLGDHRRRHPRPLLQKSPDLRLIGVCDLAPRSPLELRRPVGVQRGPDRVPGHPQPP